MNNPQEVIIYRGPAEYALYNSEFTFPLIVAAVVFLVVTVIATRVIQSFFKGYWHHGFKGHIRAFGGVYVGALVTLLVFLNMVSL